MVFHMKEIINRDRAEHIHKDILILVVLGDVKYLIASSFFSLVKE